MPTYDYQCNNCDHSFEEFQSITSNPLRKCPECSKNTLKRLIGCGAGVIFKGSGFYQTDYRSDSYKAGEKAAKEASSSKKDSDKGKDSGAAKSSSGKSNAGSSTKSDSKEN